MSSPRFVCLRADWRFFERGGVDVDVWHGQGDVRFTDDDVRYQSSLCEGHAQREVTQGLNPGETLT